MDVASMMAVSVAPPPFQKEVEEARRDNLNRPNITQIAQGHASKEQTHIGDRRGSTDGENSNLAAQQKALSDVGRDDLTVKERLPKRKNYKKRKQEQEKKKKKARAKREEINRAIVEKHLSELNAAIAGAESLSYDEEKERQHLQEKAGFDPDTGYYFIPAWKHQEARAVFLEFKEDNVHFLEQFSDRETAIGLINFALSIYYGRIIPHSRKGQVVEHNA